MIRLEFRGEYEPARKIHHSFTELYSLLFVDGNKRSTEVLDEFEGVTSVLDVYKRQGVALCRYCFDIYFDIACGCDKIGRAHV